MSIYSFEEVDLPYVIAVGKELIGAFQNSIDRDDCLAFLKDRYKDIKFKAINVEE
jgi:hypothetical protein